MPQPPLSLEKMRLAHDAVAQHGTATAAAAALGIRERTFNGWYRAALRNGMPEVRPDLAPLRTTPAGVTLPLVTLPDLPKSDVDVEELIRQREEAFRRKYAAHAARQWMRFTINDVAPFGLVFMGDWHGDDNGTDWPRLRHDIETIRSTPGFFPLALGDASNNWVGRLARLYANQSTSARESWQLVEWLIRQLNWLIILRGNHDMWSGDGDPIKWIAAGSIVEDWQARFEVACGEAVWRIHAAHDFPGHSMWNRLHAPLKRAKMSGHDADLYVAGHRHNWGLAEEQDEHSGRVAWLARAKGYKALDSYAANLGYGQAQDRGQSITAICTPADGKMRCFSDLDEAAAYLTWLRRPRVRVRAA